MTDFLGHNQHPAPEPAWFGTLPIAYFLQNPLWTTRLSMPLVMALQGIALLQVLVLFGLYQALRPIRRFSSGLAVILGAGALAMLVMALRATVMSSSDLYFYVGSALANPSPYRPDAVPFAGEQAVINQIWGLPLLPSVYGPLWTALSKLAVSTAHSLAGQLSAMRWLEVVALFATAALLFVLSRSVALAALVVLNPALFELYVVDGHNDLLGVALVLAAMVSQSRLWISIPLAAAAGLIKLPFALVAMLAFSNGGQLARRLVPALAAAGVSVLVSAILVGPDYLAALRQIYLTYQTPAQTGANVAHALLALFCLVSVALVIARRTILAGAPWSFLAFGQRVSTWYLAWGVPYAALDESLASSYFITLPVLNVLLATVFPRSPLVALLQWCLVAALLYAFACRVRGIVLRRRTAR